MTTFLLTIIAIACCITAAVTVLREME